MQNKPVLKAIILDFDGVLVDTEPLHFKMFQRVLHEEGLPLSEQDYYQKYVGLDDKGCFQTILSANGRRSTRRTASSLKTPSPAFRRPMRPGCGVWRSPRPIRPTSSRARMPSRPH